MSDQTVMQLPAEREEHEQDKAHVTKEPYERRTLKGGTVTFATLAIADAVQHLGLTGLVFSGIVSYAVWRHGPEVAAMIDGEAGFKELAGCLRRKRTRVPGDAVDTRTFWQKAWNLPPSPPEAILADSDAALVSPAQAALPLSHTPPSAEETPPHVFATEGVAEVPGVARITVEQCIEHTTYNSYEVWLGRSLTRPGNPAVKVEFRRRHLKLIGASQRGKSSMAAALLSTITRTHDPAHVQVAVLDLEDKTGRLFAGSPHLARVRLGDEMITLHARSHAEVLAHLELLSKLVDYRYTLDEAQLDRLPVILVYIEEFLDLKNYFKNRVEAVSPTERDQARADYARLIYIIKKIAARGLKVLVQLVMCAQVDYRDADLQEALVNITGGMSFAVRASAAQAAGFTLTDLLSRCAREDRVGQMVVEMSDCKDLVLAPEFDLRTRLKELTPTTTRLPESKPASVPIDEPIPPLANVTREMTALHRACLEHYHPAISYRQLGELIGVGKDKAGDLIKDLVKWGLIEPRESE